AMNTRLRISPWTMLCAAALVSLVNTGFPYFGASMLNSAMAQQLALERSVLGLGFTIMLLVQGVCGPLITATMHRHGIRATITGGSLILAAGAALMATAVDSAASYLFAFGLVVGVGVGASTYIPTQTLIAHWFDRHRALAFSIVLIAGGCGGAIAPALLAYVLAHNGGNWRAGWWLVAGAALTIAILVWLVVRDRQALPAAPGGVAAAGESAWTAGRLLRTPLIWIIALGDLAVGMPIMAFFAHGIPHLNSLGHDTAQASVAVGLLAGAGALGQLVSGLLGDRLDPRHVWSMALFCVMAGLLLLLHADSTLSIYLFALLLGGGYGAGLICKSAMIGRYLGAAAFGKVMGTMAPVSIGLTALSPYLVGLSYDRFGSYVYGFGCLALLALCAALAQLFARPMR
ncbi:MAG: MFS transporter, partial [Solimonas sp.]